MYIDDYIPLNECVHNALYMIIARNFYMGIFNKLDSSFIGIRYKFGHRFLDKEFHFDTGPPYGSAQPVKFVKNCVVPVHNYFENYDAVFEWLQQQSHIHKDAENYVESVIRDAIDKRKIKDIM